MASRYCSYQCKIDGNTFQEVEAIRSESRTHSWEQLELNVRLRTCGEPKGEPQMLSTIVSPRDCTQINFTIDTI